MTQQRITKKVPIDVGGKRYLVWVEEGGQRMINGQTVSDFVDTLDIDELIPFMEAFVTMRREQGE